MRGGRLEERGARSVAHVRAAVVVEVQHDLAAFAQHAELAGTPDLPSAPLHRIASQPLLSGVNVEKR